MSVRPFIYEELQATRSQLIQIVNESLEDADREFLLSVNRLEPNWSIYDFSQYPSVKWKLINLEKFKKARPHDFQSHLDALRLQLES
jgi:hypothetical protein